MSTDQIVIFGSNGILGSNLLARMRTNFPNAAIILPSRSDVEAVHSAKFLKNISTQENLILFYSHGPTDPQLDLATHRKYHVDLPAEWNQYLSEYYHLTKFITFGSIQESQGDLIRQNRYLLSKNEWAERIEKTVANVSHVLLHTVYGRPIRSNSFIGQMANALKEGVDFRMSDGNQSREYQNAEDVAEAVSKLADLTLYPTVGSFVVSHGQLISLREIATGVFLHFGALDRLKLGALPTLLGDSSPPPAPDKVEVLPIPIRQTVEEIIQLLIREGIRG